MKTKTTLGFASVDQKIDWYIRANESEPYEEGPAALESLFSWVIESIAADRFARPSEVCAYIRRRLREYEEEE